MRLLISCLMLLTSCATIKPDAPSVVERPLAAQSRIEEPVETHRQRRKGPERRLISKIAVCDSGHRFQTRNIFGPDGQPDKLEVCMKRADGSYVMVLATAP